MKTKEGEYPVHVSAVLPWTTSIIFVVAFTFVGLAGSVFRGMLADFHIDPIPFKFKLLLLAHWMWTLPVALLVGIVLITGSRRWSQRTGRVVNWTVMAIACLLLAGFAVSVFTRIDMQK